MNKEILIYLKNIGKAEEKLQNLLSADIFNTISKHDPRWDSEHEREADQLDEARRALSFLHDQIGEVLSLMYLEEE